MVGVGVGVSVVVVVTVYGYRVSPWLDALLLVTDSTVQQDD